MAVLRKTLACWLLLISCTLLRGQSPLVQFDHLNLEEGLSQGSIYCILQDHRGYLWFGTQDGLNKYDGYNFTVYRYDKNDSASLSDNWINALYEDSGGTLWIATFNGGLNRFNREEESFSSFEYDPEDSTSISSDGISAIIEGNPGTIWIGTANGINRFTTSKTKEIFTRYHLGGDRLSNQVTCIFMDSHNFLWAGTKAGLYYYEPAKDKFVRKLLNQDSLGHPANYITRIYEDPTGRLLIGTHDGLFQRMAAVKSAGDPGKIVKIETAALANHQISDIYADENGILWVGLNEDGLIRWDEANHNTTHLVNDPARSRSLSNNLVNSLYYDKFGNLWVGTLNGINKYSVANRKFYLYQNEPGISHNVRNSIFAIQQDLSGNVWTATRDGIFRFNRNQNTLTRFSDEITSEIKLKDHIYRAIYRDISNILWLGGQQGYLESLDPETGDHSSYRLDEGFSGNEIYTIIEDTEGNLWIGAINGLYRFDKKTAEIRHYYLQEVATSSVNNNEIRSLAFDDHGDLWIGTRGVGLFHFDTSTEKSEQFNHEPGHPNSLSHDLVVGMYIDSDGIIWLGTASGFNRFDPTKKSFHYYSMEDGLPNDLIYSILPDNVGNLWLSTNNGISRFDTKKETFRNFTTSDGLQGSEFNSGAYFRNDRGELFFGGLNGYNSFLPSEIKDNKIPAEVVLTDFKVMNEKRDLKKSLENVSSVTLDYRDYFFSFEFAALHLVAPEKNTYAYKMEGFDRDWIYTPRRFATYTNLDPGEYVFLVKAANNDGIWNQQPLAITVSIAPPFWRTWWFYLLMIVVIISLIYLLYKFRVSQVRKEEKLKTVFNKRLAEIEMTALRAQMNPHFLFNCLNSINRYIVKSDVETASGYLTKFSRLIRLILQNSKSATVPLESDLDALRLYIEMEEMRFEDQFDYTIQVEESVEADLIEIPPLLIQPYVENAIWHGLMHKPTRGELKVEINRDSEWLRCIIEDNGIGRKLAGELRSKSATRNKSMGMRITTDRLSLVKQLYNKEARFRIEDLVDAYGEAAGTRVTLDIPFSRESWRLHPERIEAI